MADTTLSEPREGEMPPLVTRWVSATWRAASTVAEEEAEEEECAMRPCTPAPVSEPVDNGFLPVIVQDLRNLTPHTLHLHLAPVEDGGGASDGEVKQTGEVVVELPSMGVLRASESHSVPLFVVHDHAGRGTLPVEDDAMPQLGDDDVHLLEVHQGHCLVVSRVAAEAALRRFTGRTWKRQPTMLLGPNSAPGQAVRDAQGRLVGVRGLVRFGVLQ
jgi:hypothetical protein